MLPNTPHYLYSVLHATQMKAHFLKRKTFSYLESDPILIFVVGILYKKESELRRGQYNEGGLSLFTHARKQREYKRMEVQGGIKNGPLFLMSQKVEKFNDLLVFMLQNFEQFNGSMFLTV